MVKPTKPVASKPKKEKKPKTSKNTTTTTTTQPEDILSNLHTSLLHHILSFLPSKTVVRTCVLSKRWQHLWESTPTLDFDHSLYPFSHRCAKRNYFTFFIDRFLHCRDRSNIFKFRLKCGKSCNPDHVKNWIHYAANHNVHDVDIRLIGQVHLRNLFTCESLRILQLNLSGSSLKFPNSSTKLPNLKTLNLSYTCFEDKKLATNFFSNCPVLEDLMLRDCEFGRNFYFSAPQLRTLTLRYLNIEPERVCKFTVSVKSLRQFQYKGFFGLECSLEDVSDLYSVDLDLWMCNVKVVRVNNTALKRLVKMLTGLFNAQHLTLTAPTLEILSTEQSLLDCQPSPFCALKSLKVMTHNKHTVLPIHAINYLLKCSPNARFSIEFIEDRENQ